MNQPSTGPRRLRAAAVVPALLFVLQIGAGIALAITLPEITPMDLRGNVRCTSGEAVQGVWVEGFSGGSHFATLTTAPDRSVTFDYRLPYGGKYQVHVGCGGTPAQWRIEVWSEYVEGTGHSFLCHDQPGTPAYKTCTSTR